MSANPGLKALNVEPNGAWNWVTNEAFDYTNRRPREPNNQTSAGFQEGFLHVLSIPAGSRKSTWNDFFDHPALRLNAMSLSMRFQNRTLSGYFVQAEWSVTHASRLCGGAAVSTRISQMARAR
jgi:hypothetical protein